MQLFTLLLILLLPVAAYTDEDSSDHDNGHDCEHDSENGYGHHKKDWYKNNLYIDDRRERFEPTEQCARAQDLVESFQALVANDPHGRFFAIVDGQSIDRIVNVEVAEGGTMLVITIAHGYREERRVVRVSQVQEIGQRVGHPSSVRIPSSWRREPQ